MSNFKQQYRALCKQNESIPIFSKDWWLDAVCGEENWDVCLIDKSEEIIGALPYYIKRKLIWTPIRMPILTQTMGPWLRFPPNQKLTSRISYEKKVLSELIQQLPKFDYFEQRFHYSFTNWLPFYWNNFQQTTRYTYVLDSLENLGQIFEGFASTTRRIIRKASDIVKIYSDDDYEKFINTNTKTFARQNMRPPYSLKFVKRLDDACALHNARRIFFAEDKNKKIHGALYIVWDGNSAYHLMSGADPDLRSSGSASLLLWEAIKYSSKITKRFDFEGSMIEPIEGFFRGFGAKQVPFFTIKKINSRLLKVREYLIDFLK